MPGRQSGSPRQQCIRAISASVDSIDSHIILRMIRESKSVSYKILFGLIFIKDISTDFKT